MEEKKGGGDRASRGRPRGFDREAALKTALRLFWEQGYQQTTMAQLCAEMGIKSPSLYCAFGNKANLFLEALEYYRRAYWQKAFDDFVASEDLREGARRLFLEAARILLLPENRCGCLTVFAALTLPLGETEVLKAVSEMRRQTKKMFQDRLEKALREGRIDPDCNAAVTAGALTNFFEGLTLQARDRELSLDELSQIALSGLSLMPKEKTPPSVRAES